MKKILLSTAYFPPIGYFYFLIKNAKIEIEAYETYPKQTFRNRCHILSPNGIQSLSIPVNKTNGNHTYTHDIQISIHSDWRRHHWKSLQTAYNKSAFFMYYKDELWKTMQYPTNNLFDYNLNMIKFLLEEMGIKKTINTTENYIENPPETLDLRTKINPKDKVPVINNPEYFQVFSNKYGFLANLSILDLLFNEGPNTLAYLQSIPEN